MDILDSEKRRAQNLIWNAAGDYSFQPDFKAYDEEGRAALYWNCVIGAVRKHYGGDAIDALFAGFKGCKEESTYEVLIWLGLENAVFPREAACRPALPSLRLSYARHVIALNQRATTGDLVFLLEDAHFRRVLGEEAILPAQYLSMLDALEFPSDLDGPALTERATAFLQTYFHFVPGKEKAETDKAPDRRWFFRGRPHRQKELPSVRAFGHGFGEHTSEGGGKEVLPELRRISDHSLAQTEATLRQYIRDYFGTPLYSERQLMTLENALCVSEHAGCHLYYALGDDTLDPEIRGYAGSQRRAALRQMERNRAAYEADATRHRASILQLAARIRNAMQAYLQPATVRSPYGALDGGRVWRGVYLDDDKVFTRVLNADPGALSVDLLLDGSTSQIDRQTVVAAQGYMIAEALTRCHIPVRVTSFCSLSGYTILTRYRDYEETDKNERIFHYFTAGCNRDGLALRALGRELEDAPCPHRLVILLSDAKPNDVIKFKQNGEYLEYANQNGIQNTAMEVRSLLRREISVICVFTGEDGDLPAAHTIYGRSFARIRCLDRFADTVGTLIQNQIRSF
jgi:hypothetical protein